MLIAGLVMRSWRLLHLYECLYLSHLKKAGTHKMYMASRMESGRIIGIKSLSLKQNIQKKLKRKEPPDIQF